jgi:hypothetical protein
LNVKPNVDELQQAIVSMAVESWRFGTVFGRVLPKLDAGEQSRYQGQLRWFLKKVEESLAQVGLVIVNVEGHPFDPGIAATPLNLEDFEPTDLLIVDRMIEPLIMGEEGVVRAGVITVRRIESS